MAYIGLAHIVMARCGEQEDGTVYTNGLRFGRAIKVSIDPKYEDVSDYGDINDEEETDMFAYADLTLETGELSQEVEGIAFGHAIQTGDILSNETDQKSCVGIGMRCREVIEGKTGYTALWLYKVKLTEDGISHETKGDAAKYDTASTKGKAVPRNNGDWRLKKRFDTAEEADSWLNSMAGIE